MKFDISKTVRSLDGTSLIENGKEVTFGNLFGGMLLTSEQSESAQQKFICYGLATKLYGQNEVDLNDEEISLIRKKVGAFGTPLAVGRTFDFLEGK